MRYLGVLVMMILVNVALAQVPSEKPVALSNGNVEVTGLDPFGAMVTVEYNGAKEKVYQERTLNGQTIYVHFAKGQIVEYGTIVKPALVSNDDIRIDESIDP